MEQLYASVADFQRIVGLGRSTVYEMLARGELRGIKLGARTLIDMPHAREYLANQPAAQFTYSGKAA